jgi:hypothetical protein
VFTARYALSPYIEQIRFVFKGLNNCLMELCCKSRCLSRGCLSGTESSSPRLEECPTGVAYGFTQCTSLQFCVPFARTEKGRKFSRLSLRALVSLSSKSVQWDLQPQLSALLHKAVVAGVIRDFQIADLKAQCVCMISGFRRCVNESFALLGCYAA